MLSEIDKIFGAYGDVGRDDFCDGEPRPHIPDTLYLLLEDVDIVGRAWIGGALLLLSVWRLEAELEFVSVGWGGVVAPYVEFKVVEDFVVGTEPFVPLDPPLLESVLRSVLKLALERRRISFKKEGAIFTCA